MGLLALGGLTLLLCVLAFRSADVSNAGTDGTSTREAGTAAAQPSATPDAGAPPPSVPDQRRADFTKGDALPDGSRVYDSSTSVGMAVVDGQLVHGPPEGAAAESYLELRLPGSVTKLGAQVRFAPGASGSIALVAWPTSVVAAARADRPLPSSGLRLTATSHSWKATVGADREVIAKGDFVATGPLLTFEVVRAGADLWVTDPAGDVAQVSEPRVAELAGPWACWELFETASAQVPAAFAQVWAG